MFIILFVSNLIITYIGSAFVLKADPFWDPSTFIPVIGMLLGNSMSSVAMATERCLDQFRYINTSITFDCILISYVSVHAPMLETRLSFGASRYEASLPLAVEAIRIALLPVITQLSVMGMINIPGMMTGQIMAGTPMMEAVMYQQCIMFMVAASSTFGVVMSVAVSFWMHTT
jgi:ABC-type iron transport system FetAB permease component